MKIFHAVGLLLVVIAIKLIMPEVFAGFEHVILAFFHTMESVFTMSQDGFTHGLSASILPQLPR